GKFESIGDCRAGISSANRLSAPIALFNELLAEDVSIAESMDIALLVVTISRNSVVEALLHSSFAVFNSSRAFSASLSRLPDSLYFI
ncbi:hypothetical protein, partial [Escherichia coli]|uniref:hypothetical protein n=1 Tax=Escherichia coli TaxID=562 RepID=UPI001F44AFBB